MSAQLPSLPGPLSIPIPVFINMRDEEPDPDAASRLQGPSPPMMWNGSATASRARSRPAWPRVVLFKAASSCSGMSFQCETLKLRTTRLRCEGLAALPLWEARLNGQLFHVRKELLRAR
jgi:hypothetical protein